MFAAYSLHNLAAWLVCVSAISKFAVLRGINNVRKDKRKPLLMTHKRLIAQAWGVDNNASVRNFNHAASDGGMSSRIVGCAYLSGLQGLVAQ